MLVPVQSQSITIDNYSIEFIALPVYEMENKLRILLPKVDRGSNWLGAIGIFVSIFLGIISYLSIDAAHRPSSCWTKILSLTILVVALYAIYLLYKSYNAIGVEKIVEELKKDSSKFDVRHDVKQNGEVKDNANSELGKQSQSAPVILKPKGTRKKKKSKKNH